MISDLKGQKLSSASSNLDKLQLIWHTAILLPAQGKSTGSCGAASARQKFNLRQYDF
jgi:hypothetical protein